MRTALYQGDGQITVADRPAAAPGPDDVRIAVAYTGICGTDLHVLHGTMDSRVTVPQAIGHEMSGTVESVGAHVSHLAAGQRVTVMPLLWCGECAACTSGNTHICQNLDFVGIETPGALQELWTVPASIVIPIPDEVPLRDAALIEPLAVACHDVARSRLAAGETAVVIGGGPIGQLISLVAQSTGARVIVIEPAGERRSFAAAHGAQVIDPATEDAAALVEQATGGAGADVVFEVAGAGVTALTSVDYARVRGRVVIVAIHAQPTPMNLHRVFWRELEIIGTRVYERNDFDRAIGLLAAGSIAAADIITDVLPLDHTLDAFHRLEGGDAMKLLIDVRKDAAS
ncbi:zinc-binding dehydrogenase [Microbacterium sp. MPKO10]|uniref:zinc-dependent alcohol dehydrogenase n=1 Tax=Microbacterium sp. MPKO10 TaxID=2989818 RepID=UPI0022359EDA|nr:alcohol dehydrogenase catalytic domain-containing protein [Microbacterium sp. MPKO10]MCW4457034.1 alcohol dehydrogenase catalytic domain-containing protein [Microbacterium sp. MPKO10]